MKGRIDPYLSALFGVVLLASVLPAHGALAALCGQLTNVAITLLFFLYGARLSPEEAWAGARHIRLHAMVLASTYVLFPVLTLCTQALVPTLLSSELYLGLVFLGTLPSTVQSSIAFTSVARGNVAAAVCAASASNLLGVVLTPLLVGLLLGQQGVSFSTAAIPKLVLQLLAPFVLGQLLRPRIGPFVVRHKRLLSVIDRGSILLVVYTAFSAGMATGIWKTLSLLALAKLLLVSAALLAVALSLTTVLSRRLGFSVEDEITIVFCGSKKSLVSGLPIASVLFPADAVSLVVLPLMLFHQLQLLACAWLARRYAARSPTSTAP